MFPWVYEFRWSAGHLIFLGVFFTVGAVIIVSLVVAAWRAYRTFRDQKNEHVQWEAEFEDLPLAVRACRHELSGKVPYRTCRNSFDCRVCETHSTFRSRSDPHPEANIVEDGLFGLSMPLDRYYHRGHAWAKKEGGAVYSIGLDDFGSRLIGVPDALDLPPVGTRLHANGMGWQMVKEKSRLRVLAPIDGVVVEHGGVGNEWYLKVRVEDDEMLTRHLLRGKEVRQWLMREIERLQYALAPAGMGLSLADGGEMVPDMWKHAPAVDWDGVWGEMLLRA